MEEFEVKTLSTCPHPPSLWLRFVDDTFVITKAEHSQEILQHINSQDPHIQFTVELTQQGSLPFLDTLVTIEPNNIFSTIVYRKLTHTDQYLHWDSKHNITTKQSVYNTLAHRAKVVSSCQGPLDKELQHIQDSTYRLASSKNGLSTNGITDSSTTNNTSNNSNINMDNNHNNNTTKRNITIVVPCIKGISEKFKGLCRTKDIQVHFKGTNPLRTQLVNPKDKDPKTHKSGIIYHHKYPRINCPEAYIGESGRALGERVKEHLKAPSQIIHHSAATGHPLDSDNFNIIHKKVHSHSRTIKGDMFICVNDPTLNRNLGNYQLPYIWDSILQAPPMLHPQNTPKLLSNSSKHSPHTAVPSR